MPLKRNEDNVYLCPICGEPMRVVVTFTIERNAYAHPPEDSPTKHGWYDSKVYNFRGDVTAGDDFLEVDTGRLICPNCGKSLWGPWEASNVDEGVCLCCGNNPKGPWAS